MNPGLFKAIGIALLATALLLGISGYFLTRQPPRYAATASVKVERDQIDLLELASVPELAGLVAAQVDSTYFIQTEIEVVRSAAILGNVIAQLKLTEVWGSRLYDGLNPKLAEALALLKDRLQVRAGEGSVIDIQAVSELPEEAVAIANATAQAYCEYRADYRRRLAQTGLDALAERNAEMLKNIDTAREKLERVQKPLDAELLEQATTSPAEASNAVRILHSHYSKSALRYLAQSNQLVLYQLQTTNVDENVAQLNARADRAKADLAAAELALREEMARQELVRNYQAAQNELHELTALFAPRKKAVADLQRELGPQETPPASILERAAAATAASNTGAPKGRLVLVGSAVALVLGIGSLACRPGR